MALSWIALLAGAAIGVFGLAIFGAAPVIGEGGIGRGWWFAAGGAVLGFSFVASSALSFRNRKRAGLLLIFSGPVTAILVWLSQFAPPGQEFAFVFLPCLTCLAFGWFWVTTGRRGWLSFPSFVKVSRFSKMACIAAAAFLLALTTSIGSIALTMREPDVGDCGEGSPNYRPGPENPVFVARVIHFDRFLGSVGVVQERFWDLAHNVPFVFLKAPGKPGDIYFVDGRLSSGLLTRWLLPVINMYCSRSELIPDAAVDLRVLRGGVPKPGVRLIGKVEKRGNHREVVPGVKVIITGAQGTIVTQTDDLGIYDVTGLPPGHYAIRADVYSDALRRYPSCPNYEAVQHLESGEVWGCTLRIDSHR